VGTVALRDVERGRQLASGVDGQDRRGERANYPEADPAGKAR
jgi:hypothetical protein